MPGRKLEVAAHDSPATVREAVQTWVERAVPPPWRAAAQEGRQALRLVRSRESYESWYPIYAESGLVVPTWPVAYGGLDLPVDLAMAAEEVLAPFNLGRLNPLGLNCAAPALFSYGSEAQRLRYLPPIVANREIWCQLLSEPGAGSDLASLATRAERDGDEWVVTGQKVWTTWAHVSHLAVCLTRTDASLPKRQGLTYFIIDMSAPGVTVRPLRHLGGEIDFNEVFLDEVRVPDTARIGATGDGWRVAGATLAGERQMVSGAGSGGVDRIGGGRAASLPGRARDRGVAGDALARQAVAALWGEESLRSWTNERVRAARRAGQSPGAAASIGKVDQGGLNQRIQLTACGLLGAEAQAWPAGAGGVEGWAGSMPYEVAGMLRSRANSIEGGTTEINKNIVGEKVLGLPREPDPWRDQPWEVVPRS